MSYNPPAPAVDALSFQSLALDQAAPLPAKVEYTPGSGDPAPPPYQPGMYGAAGNGLYQPQLPSQQPQRPLPNQQPLPSQQMMLGQQPLPGQQVIRLERAMYKTQCHVFSTWVGWG